MNVKKILSQTGMNAKEVEVYLIILEFGLCNASFVASKLGENRVTIHDRLKKMMEDGFLHIINKGGVSHFSVKDPYLILNDYKHKAYQFESIIPYLLSLSNNQGKGKVKVQFFEGMNAVQNQRKDILTSKSIVKAFRGESNMDPEFRKWIHEEFITLRKKHNTRVQVILSHNSINQSYHELDDEFNLKDSIIVNHPFFRILASVVIYDNNKVSIGLFTKEELSGVIIQSKQLFQFIEHLFHYIRAINSGK